MLPGVAAYETNVGKVLAMICFVRWGVQKNAAKDISEAAPREEAKPPAGLVDSRRVRLSP